MLKRTRKGMTLLELIVVIVILGILAAIAIPTFLSIIDKSHYSSLETTAHAIDNDALALAAFTPGAAPTEAQYHTAATETSGASVTTGTVTGSTFAAGSDPWTDSGTPAVCVSSGNYSVLLTSSGIAATSGSVLDYADSDCSGTPAS